MAEYPAFCVDQAVLEISGPAPSPAGPGSAASKPDSFCNRRCFLRRILVNQKPRETCKKNILIHKGET